MMSSRSIASIDFPLAIDCVYESISRSARAVNVNAASSILDTYSFGLEDASIEILMSALPVDFKTVSYNFRSHLVHTLPYRLRYKIQNCR